MLSSLIWAIWNVFLGAVTLGIAYRISLISFRFLNERLLSGKEGLNFLLHIFVFFFYTIIMLVLFTRFGLLAEWTA